MCGHSVDRTRAREHVPHTPSLQENPSPFFFSASSPLFRNPRWNRNCHKHSQVNPICCLLEYKQQGKARRPESQQHNKNHGTPAACARGAVLATSALLSLRYRSALEAVRVVLPSVVTVVWRTEGDRLCVLVTVCVDTFELCGCQRQVGSCGNRVKRSHG